MNKELTRQGNPRDFFEKNDDDGQGTSGPFSVQDARRAHLHATARSHYTTTSHTSRYKFNLVDSARQVRSRLGPSRTCSSGSRPTCTRSTCGSDPSQARTRTLPSLTISILSQTRIIFSCSEPVSVSGLTREVPSLCHESGKLLRQRS